MSKCMVKLGPSQQSVLPVKHPVLKKVSSPLAEDEINELIPQAIAGSTQAREKLILGHLGMLRHTIGRYLYHWPLTRRFLDEMVSVGLITLTRQINMLTEDTLNEHELGVYLLQHICKHIEIEIAKLRGIAPASMRTNQRRVEKGKEPIYGAVETNLQNPHVKDGFCYMEAGFEELETMEVIELLQNDVDSYLVPIILSRDCWGLNDHEIARKTGAPQQTVSWCRQEMLKRYDELTGE